MVSLIILFVAPEFSNINLFPPDPISPYLTILLISNLNSFPLVIGKPILRFSK